MSDLKVIEAAKNGDTETLNRLLAGEANVNEQDEHGWTPLNWAAGKGDVETVKLLLEHGADITLTGRDNRTPLMIAKAANRKEVAAILTEEEKKLGIWKDPRETRPYCKAYYLRDLRKFNGWSESRINWKEDSATQGDDGDEKDKDAPFTDDKIVYVHQDFTVTESMWHNENVIYNDVTPEWVEFCEKELKFAIPEDLL